MKTWFVADDALHAVEGGLELDVRLPWYRSLPLSVIDFGEVRIDGISVNPNAIVLKINGKDRKLSELRELWKEYWYVLDSAYLRFPHSSTECGKSFQIEVTIILHPPYIPKVFFPITHNKLMCAN